jgi:hypothetical protein
MEIIEKIWHAVRGVWEAEGPSLDPDGSPAAQDGGGIVPPPSSAEGDAGPSLDPDG